MDAPQSDVTSEQLPALRRETVKKCVSKGIDARNDTDAKRDAGYEYAKATKAGAQFTCGELKDQGEAVAR
jgi:isopentenyl diphosphate isomerase/L-lactate dehydrogenase-like FMN-dependent dehydrogenase